jgi:hypothetical protein
MMLFAIIKYIGSNPSGGTVGEVLRENNSMPECEKA